MGTLPPDLVATLAQGLGRKARIGEPLARHTSFRVGGPADLLAIVDRPEELAIVLAAAREHAVRVTLLGGGSNMVVGDGGVAGVVVKLGRGFAHLEWRDEADRPGVRAGAAVQLGRLARTSAERGLAGLEFAEGIPGTVGGALFMNAGAYGGELAKVVAAVEGVDPVAGPCELASAGLTYRYRRTELPPGFVVTAVTFALRREEAAAVKGRMDAARAHRVSAQPQGQANAGSIFKNPPGDHAGRLIEAAGLKGTRAGGARISRRHANVIVNEGGARAVDVQALIELAQRVVWERDGVWLEPEVKLLGNW